MDFPYRKVLTAILVCICVYVLLSIVIKEIPISKILDKGEKFLNNSGSIHYDKEIDRLSGILDSDPKNAEARSQLANAYSSRGINLRYDEKYDPALKDLIKAMELGSNSFDVYYNVARIYGVMDDDVKCIEYYTKAIQLDPSEFWSRNNRSVSYIETKQFDKAIDDCNIAIKIDGSHPYCYLNLGRAYEGKKDFKKAGEYYTKSIELDPGGENGYLWRGYFYEYTLSDHIRAVEDYSAALRINPKNAISLNNRANAYSALKDLGKALEDYKKAIELDPTARCGCKYKGTAYCNRGNLYYHNGEYDKAIADYTRAIELCDTDPDRFEMRGNAYSEKREVDKATADLIKARDLRKARRANAR